MIKAEDLLNMLTDDDIIEIMKELGSDEPIYAKGALVFESICHGSDSHKLYWYKNTKRFHCWSCCGNMSLWQVICYVKGWDIQEDFFKTVLFVAKMKGVDINTKHTRGSTRKSQGVDYDLAFLRKHRYERVSRIKAPKIYDSSILDRFEDCYPIDWYNEGIDEITAEKFGIMFDSMESQAIIPHRDRQGNLIGVRVRNFKPEVVERGAKYTPLYLGGEWYRFPTGETFYGLYENGEDIEREKMVYLFESEKSIMMMDSHYDGHGMSLATMGTNFSLAQRDILLNMGIKRVVICFDREYQDEWYDEEYKNTKEYRLMIGYFKKLLKIYNMLNNYMEVSIILDWQGILPMKSSPIDEGREVFEKLLKEQCFVVSEEELNNLAGVDFDAIFGC